jgi:deoxycytidine triphosphate deaminase
LANPAFTKTPVKDGAVLTVSVDEARVPSAFVAIGTIRDALARRTLLLLAAAHDAQRQHAHESN